MLKKENQNTGGALFEKVVKIIILSTASRRFLPTRERVHGIFRKRH